MTIIGITEDKTAQAEAASLKVEQQQGASIADTLFDTIKKQATGLKPFLESVYKLSNDGRKAFRAGLKTHLDAMRKELKALENDVNYTSFKKAVASATVRMSEVKGFSEACDIQGFEPNFTPSYHFIIGEATVFRQSQAKAGPAKGKAPTPVMDKVKGYIVGLLKAGALKHTQLADVEKLVHTLASMNPKEVVAPAPRPVKAVAPAPGDRRVKQVNNVRVFQRMSDAQAAVNTAANDSIERAAAAAK